MTTLRITASQVSKPIRVRYESQGIYVDNVQTVMREITARMIAIIDQMPNLADEAIFEATKPIFDLSQQYVPELTGALKRSGFRELQTGHQVVLGYGRGGRPWYASYVHEATWMKHANGKYAKFLERAVNERLHIFKALLQQSLEKKVGSAGRVR